jgi:hypothetical protein
MSELHPVKGQGAFAHISLLARLGRTPGGGLGDRGSVRVIVRDDGAARQIHFLNLRGIEPQRARKSPEVALPVRGERRGDVGAHGRGVLCEVVEADPRYEG